MKRRCLEGEVGESIDQRDLNLLMVPLSKETHHPRRIDVTFSAGLDWVPTRGQTHDFAQHPQPPTLRIRSPFKVPSLPDDFAPLQLRTQLPYSPHPSHMIQPDLPSGPSRQIHQLPQLTRSFVVAFVGQFGKPRQDGSDQFGRTDPWIRTESM